MANPLSSLSYTNKDFQSIYVELLDLVKELTHKWDPTISNESDPGVILLKLNAIIADKNNYNIDKNILEAFPETVTQEINARNAYKQLAYNMPWYRSATVDVMFKWVGDELAKGVVATIPKYTMITDAEGSVIYTLLEEVQFNRDQLVSSGKAIQGVIVTHTVNSSDVMDLINLDYRNRLYLNDYTIAENGVFITNVGDNENNLWKQVDNLAVKTQGNRFYEFGVDTRNSVCYIEFPEDIDALIKSGLHVKYLITQGREGNIAAKVLDRFYEDKTIVVGGSDITLNSDVVELYNNSASVDGTDPETIEQAFKSYKRTAGTFNTLVTLRDYLNAVYKSGLVSNGVVCDRFNDVQSAYSVVTEDSVMGVDVYQTSDDHQVVSYCKKQITADDEYIPDTFFTYSVDNYGMTVVSSDEFSSYKDKASKGEEVYLYHLFSEAIGKDLTAFDLRMYLLHTPGIINSVDAYESTFNMEPSSGPVHANVVGYVNEQQCVSHDFKNIKKDIPCMFKNSYPLGIKIVPQHKLTSIQQDEVKINVVKALWDVTNSRAIEFGEEPDFNIIYDTIMNADPRIKLIVLDDFQYTTFATYWTGKEFKDVPISSDSKSTLIFEQEEDTEDKFKEYLPKGSKELSKSRLNNSYFIAGGKVYRYDDKDKSLKLHSELRDAFRQQVLTKSILAGKTPLFEQDTNFQYTLDHKFINIEETERISTNQVISPFATLDEPEFQGIDLNQDGEDETFILMPKVSADSVTSAKYKLGENESVRLLAPSFITEMTYSNYVKFELVLNESTGERRVMLNRYGDGVVFGSPTYSMSKTDYINNIVLDGWTASKDDVISGEGMDGSSALLLKTEHDDQPTQFSVDVQNLNPGDEECTYNVSFFTRCLPGVAEGEHGDGFSVAYRHFKFNNCAGTASEWFTLSDSLPTTEQWGESTLSLKLPKESHSVQVRFSVDHSGFNRYIDNFKVLDESSKVVSNTGDFEGNSVSTWDLVENGSEVWYKGAIDSATDPIYLYWQEGKIKLYENRHLYEIPGNTDYQLKSGDYITFYWRESDEDDAPYKYARYAGIPKSKETETEKSPIIKSSFTVHGVSLDDAKVNPVALNSSGEIICGSQKYETVLGFYGDNDLSGTKKIEIREMNEVTLDSSKNRYYFITNKVVSYEDDTTGEDTEYYQMDFILTGYDEESKEAYYSYTLKTDEYFIYTANNMTEFDIRAPGTKIWFIIKYDGLSPDSIIAQQVIRISYNDIDMSGINAFSQYCLKIDSECEMFVREQQIHQLVEGDTIYLNIETSAEGEDVTNRKFQMISDSGKVIEVDKPYFCSWMDTIVDGFTVSYKTSTGSDVSLPRVDVYNTDSMWLGRACLNIDCSYDTPQKVVPITEENKSTQSLYINGNTYPQSVEVVVQDQKTIVDPLYVESSIQLNKVGGNDVDISYLDGYGDRLNTKLYLFNKSSSLHKGDPFQIESDGRIVGVYSEFPDGETLYREVSADICVGENSKFILSIENVSDVVSLSLKFGHEGNIEPIKGLNISTSENIGKGTYYFIIDRPYDVVYFTYTLNSDEELPETDYFVIDTLFKYKDNLVFKEKYGYTSDEMIEFVKQLDIEGKFKYNYVVDPALQIRDPLEAKKFFDENHIFKQFTIAKAETRMSDSTGSSINIINNR